jgi:hypothetical protein
MSGSGTGAVSFSITAQDDVSAKFDKIKKRVDGLTKTVDKTQKSFGSLALRDLSGLTKHVGSLAGAAGALGVGLLAAVPALAVITGAGTLAGAARLESIWADWGTQLLFTAQNIGLTATNLQTLQGAATLAGSSASSLSSGMEQLGQNLWDASGGRAPQVVAALQMMHIGWQNMDRSAKSTAVVLPQIADYIKGLHDPFAQAAIATDLFGAAGMNMLPFLRLGARGIAEYNAEAAAYGVTSASGAQAANQLRMSEAKLTLAVTGLGLTIAQNVAPVLIPMIDHMAAWVAANRQWIAGDMTGAVRGFGQAIDAINWKDVDKLFSLVAHPISSIDAGGQAVMKFGKWELGRLGGQIDGMLSAPTTARGVRDNNPLNLTYDPGQRGVVARDGRFGVFPDMATGVAANLNQLLLDQSRGANTLSKLIPTWAPSADGNNDPTYIASVSKLTGMDPNAPINMNDPNTAFKVMDAMAHTEVGGSIPSAALVAGINQRLGITGGPDLNIGSGGGDVMAGIGQHQGDAKITVDITHKNAPAGSSVSVKSSSPNVKTGTVKVETAMLTPW